MSQPTRRIDTDDVMSGSTLSPTAPCFPKYKSTEDRPAPRTNDELTPLVDAHIAQILSSAAEDTTDFAPSFDVTKPSPELAACIDHTLLKPDATAEQIKVLVEEAVKYGFKSCCVNPTHIPLVHSLLSNPATPTAGPTIPCSVIGFPLGASTTATKCYEASLAILDGARELDMVIPVGHLKSRDYAAVHADIAAVVRAASVPPNNTPLPHAAANPGTPPLSMASVTVPVKVIIETSMLTDEEKIAACYIAADAGAAFVKTSTGFGGGGATVEDIRLMRRAVAHVPTVQVKASGGVRNFEQCVAVIKAGAHRVGASSGVAIMESKEGSGY
ncbi:Deoxyribose-phosphate aldolase [Drechslerella dactyloides]|uniref:deoxyribose-phosphate aldolase n=1 Tax=Drechslerella dactyloides TaxID=74499 RepID=A0AAD6J5Z6_DREDA|nr:Deoxyribose-phosphate aldolase [Drechslerella dactyloides]